MIGTSSGYIGTSFYVLRNRNQQAERRHESALVEVCPQNQADFQADCYRCYRLFFIVSVIEIHSKYFFQFIVLYNLSHHNKSTGTQTTASCASVIRDWQLCSRKTSQIVLVWSKYISLFLRTFSYSRTLRICELLFQIINPIIFIFNIGRITMFFIGKFSWSIRQWYLKIVIC